MNGQNPVYVTQNGLEHLTAELENLKHVKRPKIVEAMRDAGGGDWIDNTEYFLLESELAFIDGRILQLQTMIYNAQIIEPGNDDNIVDIGETVVIQENDGLTEQFTIVGIAETDPGHGLISNESPLGRALLKHKIGDIVTVHAPDGTHHYRIIALT